METIDGLFVSFASLGMMKLIHCQLFNMFEGLLLTLLSCNVVFLDL